MRANCIGSSAGLQVIVGPLDGAILFQHQNGLIRPLLLNSSQAKPGRTRFINLRLVQLAGHEWTLVCLAWNLKRMAALRARFFP